jgi:hypothetical protein
MDDPGEILDNLAVCRSEGSEPAAARFYATACRSEPAQDIDIERHAEGMLWMVDFF